jgi:hypothetical protein
MYGTFSWFTVLALVAFAVGWHIWTESEKPPEPDPFEREGGRYVNPPSSLQD